MSGIGRPAVDLYSDTQTRPTAAMREAMLSAEVGDEQQRADPTVNQLCERVATELGQEAALFLPTGTMCNLVAVAVHTSPGDAVVMDRLGHILRSETGGSAVVSSVATDLIDGDRGIFTAAQLAPALEPGNQYRPPPRLVCLEQTHNFGGGTVWPLDTWHEVAELSHARDVPVHADGARLYNAVVASGVPADAWGAAVDSIWVDFTKGLGAPLGAVLAGPSDFIEAAWMWKHRLGGALRQAGMNAAACLYALDHHIDRLADDHRNARGARRRPRRARAPRGTRRDQHGVDPSRTQRAVSGHLRCRPRRPRGAGEHSGRPSPRRHPSRHHRRRRAEHLARSGSGVVGNIHQQRDGRTGALGSIRDVRLTYRSTQCGR